MATTGDPSSTSRKCPSCSGTNLRSGIANVIGGFRFRPARNWLVSYATEALACLDCGHVSLWVDGESTRHMRVFKK